MIEALVMRIMWAMMTSVSVSAGKMARVRCSKNAVSALTVDSGEMIRSFTARKNIRT